MDYPLFLVPHIGGNWLIGATAILHVIIAHFAIGGGLLIVVTEQRAARRDDLFRMEFARKQSVLLVLLSTVLGALTGVGIWFTIGLVHPAATSALIHNYVWGWAIEWVFFIVEMAAALLYVGTWNSISRRTHIRIGWIYFGAAYLVGFAWWQANIPGETRDLIFPAGSLLWRTYVAGVAVLALLTLLVAVIGYLAPRGFGLTAGIAALILAAVFFGSYERIREGARKPYVIHGYMYSNGIRVDEVDRLNREGLLTKARWAGVGLVATPTVKGEQVLRAQCQMCHSLDGYLAIRPLVVGQDAEGLTAFLDALRGGRPGMPPIIGTEEEIKALAAYLASLGGGPR